jgi:hypothetical protein
MTHTISYNVTSIANQYWLMISISHADVLVEIKINGRMYHTYNNTLISDPYRILLPIDEVTNIVTITYTPAPGEVADNITVTDWLFQLAEQKQEIAYAEKFYATIVFDTMINRWVSNLCIRPEGFLPLGYELAAFKGGKLYKVNSGTGTNSLGSLVTINTNSNYIYPKSFKTIALNSNNPPTQTSFRIQSGGANYWSDLFSNQWTKREGISSSYVPGDMFYSNDPFSGEPMIGNSMVVSMAFTPGAINNLGYCSVGHQISTGVTAI